jgi:hypothetical protein
LNQPFFYAAGTWCTPEIEIAVSKGYVIQKIYEVYQFAETTSYDPEAKEGGLFAEYINCWLRVKQEASGWPRWCKTEADKDKYISDYYKCEGIRLDRNNIPDEGKNAGLRYLAKLFLNSFWTTVVSVSIHLLHCQRSERIHPGPRR